MRIEKEVIPRAPEVLCSDIAQLSICAKKSASDPLLANHLVIDIQGRLLVDGKISEEKTVMSVAFSTESAAIVRDGITEILDQYHDMLVEMGMAALLGALEGWKKKAAGPPAGE